MRTLAAIAVAAMWLAAAVPITSAASGRADSYYTFRCIDPSGNLVDAESVDARSIEQGGKLQGSANWQAAHPEYDCWVEGPFHN